MQIEKHVGNRTVIMEINKDTNMVEAYTKDHDGNGILLFLGKLGGCGFLMENEQQKRIEILKELFK